MSSSLPRSQGTAPPGATAASPPSCRATGVAWAVPGPFVRFGEHTNPGQFDTFSHEQAEGGHEQLPDLSFSGARAGQVDSEPLGGEPAPVEKVTSVSSSARYSVIATTVAERQGARQPVLAVRHRQAALHLREPTGTRQITRRPFQRSDGHRAGTAATKARGPTRSAGHVSFSWLGDVFPDHLRPPGVA
jgi:hypothetical protein